VAAELAPPECLAEVQTVLAIPPKKFWWAAKIIHAAFPKIAIRSRNRQIYQQSVNITREQYYCLLTTV